MIFLRGLLDVAIVQLPDMNPPANDCDWSDFAACLAGPALKHQPLLSRLAPVYGWTTIVGQERNNATPLRNFKKAFNNVAAADLPTAIDVLAYFIQRPNGAATLKQYVTDVRMPDWVSIWRVCPPAKKPIDVSFNAEKLKPHFEKHVCHTPVAAHPAEECLAWMQVFKYEDRITLDYLRTLGIRPSQQHIDIMFPADAPRINVSTVAQDAAATKTATAPRLAATDAARLCFVTNYLSGSERLIEVLWREFGARYERIARDTLNACTNGFLYFETATQKVFFVGSTAANVGDYQFFVMARFGTDGLPKWEFSTLYMPRLADCTQKIQEFRANGHLWTAR